ncbi:hypothetical protein [Streptomyces fradiae]|uniref:hypothetical protein n=1 Tax=Streptomyces fradiae TaxID=1906 RepID=UPI003696FC29
MKASESAKPKPMRLWLGLPGWKLAPAEVDEWLSSQTVAKRRTPNARSSDGLRQRSS